MISETLQQKAATTNAIQIILQPFYQFRLYIKFNNDKIMTLYGHEHDCTYKQCLFAHQPQIILSRPKGYNALVNYVEHTKKGQYKKAIIYMRQPGEEKFNKICRRYFKGAIEEQNDPLFTDTDLLVLDYQVINNRVVIKTPGSAAEELPDFRKEIDNALK